MSSSWQSVWDAARDPLESLRESLQQNSVSPSARIIRIGQLDSELLDQELVNLLQEPISRSISLISSGFKARFEPEFKLLIQLALYKFSVWNLGSSYGARLQDLRYKSPPSISGPLSPSGLPRKLLLIHGGLTIVLPYVHSKLRAHALSRAWPDAPSSDRRRRAWSFLNTLESSHSMLGLLNFIAFLWDGRFRTVVDRMLGMQLVPIQRQVKRGVSYEFMNRQMVWHAFTEFLLFLLPLVNPRSIKKWFTRLLTSLLPRRSLESFKSQPKGKYAALPPDQCAICAENASMELISPQSGAPSGSQTSGAGTGSSDELEPPMHPLHTPYVASCGDIYCYTCIADQIMRAANEGDNQPWVCVRCGQKVTHADRMDALEIAGTDETTSDYELSSDSDAGISLDSSYDSL